MINDRSGKIILAATTFFIHTGILLVYDLEGKWDIYPNSWSYPFYIIVIMMMIFSMLLPFIAAYRFRLAVLMFRIIMAAVLAVPFSIDIISYGSIFAILIVEVFLYLPISLSIISFAIIFLYNIWLSTYNISLWRQFIDEVDASGFILVYSLYVICGATGFFLTREQRLRSRELTRIRELLGTSNHLATINMNLQDVAVEERDKTLAMERNRIAREIHDSVAYTLTNLLSHLDAYRAMLQADHKEVPENILQARTLVKEGLGDIRQVLRGLRPGGEEEKNGLRNIMHLVKVFMKATGIVVDINFGDVPLYPGIAIEDVIYRVVQEGLTNAFRHGQASHIFINMQMKQMGIELSIHDNGKGSEGTGEGFGLLGISERIYALNGRVNISTKPGIGFTLRVWIPMAEGEELDG